MTEDRIIEIAREFAKDGGRWPSDWVDFGKAIHREALEEAAKVCDQNAEPDMHPEAVRAAEHIASVIRFLIDQTPPEAQ